MRKWVVLLFVILCMPSAYGEEYLSQDDFLSGAFGGQPYQKKKLWLTPDHKAVAKQILKHEYNAFRIRYWQHDAKTAWTLEEIGKERPITIGVVVENNHVNEVQILAFRESRGWEVKYPFFREQFKQVKLADDYRLNRNIDGITGATLSVRAVKKVVALALYLHQQVQAS